MYLVAVEVKSSPIHGKGVFTLEDIPKGKAVWLFTPGHDQKITVEEFENLSQDQKKEYLHSGYLSPLSNMWVCPPKDDPACYTNHSKDNNMTTVIDTKVSEEPYFITNRNVKTGEELTDNYLEFDKVSRHLQDEWLNR